MRVPVRRGAETAPRRTVVRACRAVRDHGRAAVVSGG